MSSSFNPSAVNAEIRCRFFSIEPDPEGRWQFGGITRGADWDWTYSPNAPMSPPLAHDPVGIVRTRGSSPIGRTDLGTPLVGVNDASKGAVEQPVREPGSTPKGRAPTPPAATGVEDDVPRRDDDGFEKPRSPARGFRSTSSLHSSVIFDQNRWPTWMRDEPGLPVKNEKVPTPKFLWSELVEQDENLKSVPPRWPTAPPTETAKDKSDASKAPSELSPMTSEPRLTAEAKEKWRAPTPSATPEPPSEYRETEEIFPKSEDSIEILISKLKDAGLIEQLKSAETLIREQQATIDFLKQQTARNSQYPGMSGLSADQKAHIPVEKGKHDASDTESEPVRFETYEDSESDSTIKEQPERRNEHKTYQKNKKPQREATPIARASSVFPHESTML